MENISAELNKFIVLDEDTFAIQGKNLKTGEKVELVTKDGEIKTVVVGKILEEEDGIFTADFSWINTLEDALAAGKNIFTQTDNGRWLVAGKNLLPGGEVEVVTKDGEIKTVIIQEILKEEDDGIQNAVFENIEPDLTSLMEQGRLIFAKRDGKFVVRGKNLKPHTIVKVTKANGKKVKVMQMAPRLLHSYRYSYHLDQLRSTMHKNWRNHFKPCLYQHLLLHPLRPIH